MIGAPRKPIRYRSLLMISLSLSLSLIATSLAWAGYTPPKTPSAPKRSGTNITRSGSCSSNSTGQLTPLAPLSHVGQTTSTHPTLAWFVPDQTSYPLEVRIFHNQQRLYRTEMQSQPGIMYVSLPQNQSVLTPGQRYTWQVVLICDPNSPSLSVVAMAEMEVVQADLELQRQLAKVQKLQERVALYADRGLWFDALTEALKAPANSAIAANLLQSLAQVEAQQMQEWSNQLKQVEASMQSSNH